MAGRENQNEGNQVEDRDDEVDPATTSDRDGDAGFDDGQLSAMSDEEFLAHYNQVVGTQRGEAPSPEDDEPEDRSAGLLEDNLPDLLSGEDETDEAESAAAGDAAEDPESAPAPDHTTPKQEAKPQAEASGEGDGEKEENTDAEKGDEKPGDQSGEETAKAGETLSPEDQLSELFKPFRANNRDVQVRSVEEARRMMQMGANYTKKMQVLAPELKKMRMLENHGLLDESKLSFLIDLHAQKPEAIKQLLRDSKIDPLDLDLSDTSTAYTPGNHAISDEQYAFQETISEVSSDRSGKELVRLIHDTWDQVSKKAIFREPQVLRHLADQRRNGIFDAITDEIERRRMLGDLGNVPFLEAYKTVGDELHRGGQLRPAPAPDQAQPAPRSAAQPAQPTKTRPTQSSTAPVRNDKQARAVSPALRNSTSARTRPFDPFKMTDEEVMAVTSFKV